MNYSSRASPKLRYSIIEVYGGRGHRTRLRNRSRGSTCVNLCVFGVPLPQYIKEPRGRGRRPRERGAGGVLLLPGVGLPSNPIPTRNPQRGKEEKGGRPPLLVLIGLGEGGRRAAPLGCPFLLSTKAHDGPYGSRGVPVTSREPGKIPISPGTLPMSKHRLPIYQSLCLDHFETPRHVRDHIRDSEQPSVHQNA